MWKKKPLQGHYQNTKWELPWRLNANSFWLIWAARLWANTFLSIGFDMEETPPESVP